MCLTFSWRRPLSYRNQSIDLFCKSMDWFLYDRDLSHEIVKVKSPNKGVFRTLPSKCLLFQINHKIERKKVWNMFKVNNKDTSVFIIYFEHNSNIILEFILLNLRIYVFAGWQKFMMEPFGKINNSFWLLDIFGKKIHRRYLSGF